MVTKRKNSIPPEELQDLIMREEDTDTVPLRSFEKCGEILKLSKKNFPNKEAWSKAIRKKLKEDENEVPESKKEEGNKESRKAILQVESMDTEMDGEDPKPREDEKEAESPQKKAKGDEKKENSKKNKKKNKKQSNFLFFFFFFKFSN